ncbi:MAG: AI-2E family transporter [Chloroflexi bacterium]|nr:MAG: AI-2E family transporter [Chloroflexota bacterium]
MSPQWSRTTKVVIAFTSLFVIGLVFYLSRALMGPLLIAILLAYLLDPVVEFVQKRTRLSSKWSSTIVFFLFVALLITLIVTLVPVLVRQAVGLVGDLSDIERYIEELMAQPIVILGQEFRLNQTQFSDLLGQLSEDLTPAMEGALNVLEVTSTGLVWTVVVFVSTYYFLFDAASIQKWLVGSVPAAFQGDMRRLLQEIDAVWRAYVRGTLALVLIIGVVFTLVLTAVGLRGAVALGILSGLLVVLPELGPLISGVLSVIVAYIWGSHYLPLTSFWFAILVGVIYFVLMQIRAIWLQPRLIGRFLRLHHGLVFVVLIATLVLYGALPALVIIPILASFGIVGRYVRLKLYGFDPWTEGAVPSFARELVQAHDAPPEKPVWLEKLEQRRKRHSDLAEKSD